MRSTTAKSNIIVKRKLVYPRQRIAVNTRFLLHGQLEGIGLFTYESLKIIVDEHPEIDFYFLFDRPFHPSFVFAENVKPVVLFPPARHPFLWYWWFEISVSNWLNKHQPDLFLSTDGYGCLRTSVPQVLVMHDLAFEHFPEQVPLLTRSYYKFFMPRFAHKAARIATVSTYSKNDIIKQYGISPHKIDVVYNGAKQIYQPLAEAEKTIVRNKLTNGAEYFIYVGSIHPRKNIKNLLLAFEAYKTQTNSNTKLVLVGRKAWDFKEVDETHQLMTHQADVIFMGHVLPEDLSALMGSALAMVYVSLFEGFGIPIIEAMSCDVPVITSNVTSMPEAAGDAALLVNPKDVNSIAQAMISITQNLELRQDLITKGKIQRQKFSWKFTAHQLWSACKKAVV